jgi:hypothetical protein
MVHALRSVIACLIDMQGDDVHACLSRLDAPWQRAADRAKGTNPLRQHLARVYLMALPVHWRICTLCFRKHGA